MCVFRRMMGLLTGMKIRGGDGGFPVPMVSLEKTISCLASVGIRGGKLGV